MAINDPKRIFIIPYFGKFNNYFQLFLNSCKQNNQTNFLILTDDTTAFDYPQNVTVIYTSLEEISTRAESALHRPIHINRAYKLCDFKAIYGILFADLIQDYDYWGYCDTDLIFGNFDGMIEKIFEQDYDKIFFLGHCTLVRNSKEINQLLLSNRNFLEKLTDVDNNYSLDEEFNGSINTILLNKEKRVCLEELEANTYTKTSNFYLTKWNNSFQKYEIIKRKNHVFVREEKGLFEYFIENGQLIKKEYLYMHFQSRPMELKVDCNSSVYKIIPNAFEPLEYIEVSLDNFAKIKKKNWNLHYFKLRSKNLKIKLERKLKKKWK